VRTGYSIIGWTETDGNATADYTAGQSDVKNLAAGQDDVFDLYPVWEANEYNVYFDLQGGNIDDDEDPVTVPQTYGQPFEYPTPSYVGKRLVGWFTKREGDGVQYDDSMTPVNPVNATTLLAWGSEPALTLYAYWEDIPYTVQFDLKGGNINLDEGPFTKTGPLNSTLPIPDNPKRTGYKFEGWFTKIGDNQVTGSPTFEEVLSDDSIVDPDEQTIIEAKWTADKYTIWWLLEGGKYDGDTEVVTSGVEYDKPYPNPTPIPTLLEAIDKDYILTWWTKPGGPDGGGTRILPGDTKVDEYTLHYLSLKSPDPNGFPTVFYAHWLASISYGVIKVPVAWSVLRPSV